MKYWSLRKIAFVRTEAEFSGVILQITLPEDIFVCLYRRLHELGHAIQCLPGRRHSLHSSTNQLTFLFIITTRDYTTSGQRKEGYVLNKLWRGLSSIEGWRRRWKIKTSEEQTQALYL